MSLAERRDAFRRINQTMNQEYETLAAQLQENETHAQVSHTHIYTYTLLYGFFLQLYYIAKPIPSLYIFWVNTQQATLLCPTTALFQGGVSFPDACTLI